MMMHWFATSPIPPAVATLLLLALAGYCLRRGMRERREKERWLAALFLILIPWLPHYGGSDPIGSGTFLDWLLRVFDWW